MHQFPVLARDALTNAYTRAWGVLVRTWLSLTGVEW